MHTSEHIDKIAEALSKAQGNYKTVAKNKTAKVKGTSKAGRDFEYSYKYADIADVVEMLLPILSAEGLSVIQPTIVENDVMLIRTRLMHASGQWIECDYPVCRIDADHQRMGGAVTYSRRYSLCSLVGVVADEDVDGEGASEPAPAPKRERKPETPKASGYSEEQSITARALLLSSLDLCHNRAELQDWATKNQVTIQQCTETHKAEIRRAFGAKQQDIAPLKSATAAE